jgi:hypothetical protein
MWSAEVQVSGVVLLMVGLMNTIVVVSQVSVGRGWVGIVVGVVLLGMWCSVWNLLVEMWLGAMRLIERWVVIGRIRRILARTGLALGWFCWLKRAVLVEVWVGVWVCVLVNVCR